MVYRHSLRDKWHCSWCDFEHRSFEKVVEHEDNKHSGEKE